MTKGIDREQAQEKEIAELKELVENQQSRLHRMQKELQFLVTRQKVSYLLASFYSLVHMISFFIYIFVVLFDLGL